MDVLSTLHHPFCAVGPDALHDYLADPAALIIDLRSPTAHAHARLPHALNLSVPSTLLKRPLFSLQRLAAMLPSTATRSRFAAYRDAPRILVYDADAATSSVNRLLEKFRNDGYQGELAWLYGGFQSVYCDQNHLIDTSPLHANDNTDHQDYRDPEVPVLRTHSLPLHAFSVSSTTANLPMPSCPAFNPFYDTIRQNTELADGITDRIPLHLPLRVRRRISHLPFPWLQHIAGRADHRPRTRVARAPSSSPSGDSHVPISPTIVHEGTEALATQFHSIELAEQRRLMNIMHHHSKQTGRSLDHSVELGYPFSITAGVEKGAKNRYRHIWPFEHARVKLHRKPGSAETDDYVNASYVQPMCTNRRYIATQGPLDATFDDFWQLCWEQNVHVILMLTKEMEGPLIKCGLYWADIGAGMPSAIRTFGPLRLKLVAKVGLPGGVDFGSQDADGLAKLKSMAMDSPSLPNNPGQSPSQTNGHRQPPRVTTIKRTFELAHKAYPNMGSRRIVHLQYLDWSDMDVPDDPRGVLGLVHEVELAVEETGGFEGQHGVEGCRNSHKPDTEDGMRMDANSGIAIHALQGSRPVLLHCSAGVGRTGGFIAVDAVLDAVRREMEKGKGNEKEHDEKHPEIKLEQWLGGNEKERQTTLMQVDDSGDEPRHTPVCQFPERAESSSNQLNLHTNSTTISCARLSPRPIRQTTDSTAGYKPPRPLHAETPSSPVSLSTFKEPILDVIQDMREQRMSLCQTLRQYVFVHAAIIEGALIIVDEEKRRKGSTAEEARDSEPMHDYRQDEDSNVVQSRDGGANDYFSLSSTISRSPVRRLHSQPLVPTQRELQSANDERSGSVEDSMLGFTSPPPMTGKRGASPTVLLEETKRVESRRHSGELEAIAETCPQGVSQTALPSLRSQP